MNCRCELRGGKARCNGGGYDGCACGAYSAQDHARFEAQRLIDEKIEDIQAENNKLRDKIAKNSETIKALNVAHGAL